MTAIDRAFAKAYAQQDPAVSAAEGNGASESRRAERPVLRLMEPSAQPLPDEASELDVVRTPQSDSNLLPDDISTVLTGLSGQLPQEDTQQAGTPSADFPTPAYRVDPATNAPADHNAVPPPHIESVASGPDMVEALPESPFRPMLQVDKFTWSKTCQRLAKSAADEMDRLAESFAAAASAGRKVLAVGGCQRGQGATTMLLCIGRRLADWGLKNVLVDADTVAPQLARQLGILPEFGLEHVLAGHMPLEEVVIESAADRLALLPIHEPFAHCDAPSGDRTRLAGTLDRLAENYNLVLIDPGPLQGPQAIDGSLADVLIDRLDAVMLVYDAGVASRQQLADVQQLLAEAGIAQVGIIENFVRV